MTRRAVLPIVLAFLIPMMPATIILLVMFVGERIPAGFAADWIAAGVLSFGGVSAGVVSVGFASTGLISVGVLSFGVLSVGVVSSGTIAVGVWIAGLIITKPLLPKLWEAKFRSPGEDSEWKRKVAAPLQATLGGNPKSRLLDLACGTGRMTRMVLGAEWFSGTIDASDGSLIMIGRLREHLSDVPADQRSRVAVHHEDLRDWPGRDRQLYDAVTLMEVSEMLPNLETLLGQIRAVLKPGGLLMLTRTPAPIGWAFPGRGQSRSAMRRKLEASSFEDVQFMPWNWRYEIVSARAAASIAPTASSQGFSRAISEA